MKIQNHDMIIIKPSLADCFFHCPFFPFPFSFPLNAGAELELYNRKGQNSRYNLLLGNLSI
jgi:hypothetical protein